MQRQMRFLAGVTFLRTGTVVLTPRAGAAQWWLAALCGLFPVLLAAFLLLMMRKSGADTLSECVAKRLGQRAANGLRVLEGAALLMEGLCSMTALVVLFTEGVNTAANPMVIALVTAGTLALCARQPGLWRSVGLLTAPLGLMAACVLGNLLALARADHFFPLLGEGVEACLHAGRLGLGGMWPVLLLTECPPVQKTGRSGRKTGLPLACTALLAGVSAALPHEALYGRESLAGTMLLAGSFLHPINRMLLMCLWMAGLGLATAICCTEAARFFPWPKGEGACLVPALLLLLALLQGFGTSAMQSAAQAAQGWLWMPYALAALLLALAVLGQRSARR